MSHEQGDPAGDLDPEAVRLMVREAKAMLRKRAKGLRGSVPEAALQKRSAAIVERVLAVPWVRSAKRVALFYPMLQRHEVDLRALDAVLRAEGKTIGYPAIHPETKTMTFRDPGDPQTMEVRGMLAAEPAQDAPHVDELDVIIVPALLVDPRGYRLGYGAGFYDRTLPNFCPPAKSICVAYDFQVAADLPTNATDIACDMVITDARVLKDG